ncbi:DUF932 domain-containing protein [Robbsia andropogonis]|uniref:DUF932 domain-containing protein n=1 Tax=Robbsia andropogonis TaxID=28092 RepID=UPI00344D7F83
MVFSLIARYRDSAGVTAALASASGTAWGLVNSVTEFADYHRRARSDDQIAVSTLKKR